jgi:hypothetical protein
MGERKKTFSVEGQIPFARLEGKLRFVQNDNVNVRRSEIERQ